MKNTFLGLACLTTALSTPSLMADVSLSPLASIRTGIFDESAAEIVAYDKESQKLFIVNGANEQIDVADISDPEAPVVLDSIDVSGLGGPSSVAVKNGLVAVAVQGVVSQDKGVVRIFDTNGAFITEVKVGFHPDMVTFTPNGKSILVANEGELEDLEDPTSFDGEGSISIIELKFKKSGDLLPLAKKAQTISFRGFNSKKAKAALDSSVRAEITPGAKVSQDLEPEFITVSPDSKTAWVALQENNALAIVDLQKKQVTDIVGLGFKNHQQIGNSLDASNKDDAINIRPWPVSGMYQPDTIASYQAFGQTFILTANEGDARDFEEARVKDFADDELNLDPVAFPNAEELIQEENLGRLKVTLRNGDIDGDGDYDRLFSFGARSFSIRTADGELVYDSGDDFEQITAELIPENFNSTNDENDSFDNRSDDKGPEPEGLAIGQIGERTYAFIGLERVGGIMIYDISNPYAPEFKAYYTGRNFEGDPTNDTAGDLAPEGITFISAADSPSGNPLLAVGYEVSGSTTLFEIALD